MAIDMYLGYPPANIAVWIKAHSQPASHSETRFTLQGGIVETYNIIGTFDQQWMIQNGYYDGNNWEWIKTIIQTDIGNTVTSIGDDAFRDCDSMTSVTIPSSVEYIEWEAFAGCSGLMGTLTIPNSVMGIGDKAFSDCNSLTSVTIPDSTESIGERAFEYCRGLTSVTIGSGIQRIGQAAFETTGSPITLTIGKTVAEVQAMGYSNWSLPSGSTIVCTNGTITIE